MEMSNSITIATKLNVQFRNSAMVTAIQLFSLHINGESNYGLSSLCTRAERKR